MNQYHFIVGFAFLMALFLSPNVSSEENFTISVVPGWDYLVDGECETITTSNGTYEECDQVYNGGTELSGYEDPGSPSAAGSWAIGGDMANYTGDNNIRYTDVYSVSGAPLHSNFTFSLNGTNFSDDTTYSFSYSLRTSKVYSSIDHRPYWRNEPNSDAFHTNFGYDYLRVRITPNLILDTSSVLFSGNSSQEYDFKLNGQIGSTEESLSSAFDTNILLNSTNSSLWGPQTVYLNDCTRMYVEVILTRNASTDSEEILAHYISADFTPEGYSKGLCHLSYNTNYYGNMYGSGDDTMFILFGLIGLPLSLIIFSYSSAQRLNTNIFVVLAVIIVTSFVIPILNIFLILLCWLFGVNFGGGERDQEKYARSGETVPVLITIGSFVSFFICTLIMMTSMWVWSDIRLKRNIVLIRKSQSNLNIYEYNYLWSNKKYRGVMAQDLLKSKPEAVSKVFGYYLVNYNKIDVDFEKISNS